MTDRISTLPLSIIHLILSFLDTKDVVRTGALSRQWYRFWASFPILICHQSDFQGEEQITHQFLYPNHQSTEYKFITFVENSLWRFVQQDTHLQKFKIRVSFHIRYYASRWRMDQWIGLAISNHVKVMDLSVNYTNESIFEYTYPQTIFAAESLTSLVLRGGMLHMQQPITGDGIEFRSLRELRLTEVHLDEHLIQEILRSCSSIEVIDFCYCQGVKNLQVSTLQNLKRFYLWSREGEPEKLVIEAPSLQVLSFQKGSHWTNHTLSCQFLKELYLENGSISDHMLHAFVSNLSFLQVLVLVRCNALNRVKISSHSLRRFALAECEKLLEVKVDAPNLRSFNYSGHEAMPLLSWTTSACLHWEVTLSLSYDRNSFNNSWCLKLREFLGNSTQIQALTLRILCNEIAFDLGLLGDASLSSPTELEHLKLEVKVQKSTWGVLVDGLLWSCHPKTLSIESSIWFAEFLQKRLTTKKRLHYDCCSSSPNKCWRHYLKAVEIEKSVATEEEMLLSGCSSSSTTQYHLGSPDVVLRLIWRAYPHV